MAIQNRRGLVADLDTTKMVAGEFAVPLDSKEVYVAFASGDTKRMATWEDFDAQMTAVDEATDRAIAGAEACEAILIDRVGINDSSTTSTTETWSANKLTTTFAGKADLVGGTVPSSQLPSYVDDVVEGYLYSGNFYTDSGHTHLITPENGKIYVDLTTNVGYRWSGSAYSAIGSSLALGETSTTAYAGDKGKAVTDKVGNITMTTTATTVTGAINELDLEKQSKTWNYLGGVTGTTNITLPSNFSELYVIVVDGGVSIIRYSYTIIFPDIIPSERRLYQGLAGAELKAYYSSISFTTSYIHLFQVFSASVDVTSTSALSVYYR